MLRQRRDDSDDYFHDREEDNILREVSSEHLEGFRDYFAEGQLAFDLLILLHAVHSSSPRYIFVWPNVWIEYRLFSLAGFG